METLVQSKGDVLMHVPIDKIVPDPKQPRKTFNKIKDDELYEAIKQKGIIQSLLLRPYKNGYMIVCGERRFHNGKKAGLNDVPAIIRSLTDEEARIIQHIENIQRDDVNPMDQAIGFKAVLDTKRKSIEDIAAETGLTTYFIKQNICLNNLIPKWQSMVALKAIPIRKAQQISLLTPEAQFEIYKVNVRSEQEKELNPIIHVQSHVIERYGCYLTNASFDMADPLLCSNAGACTNCPFNSEYVNLFPSEAAHPRCNNIACFKNKESLHLQNEIKKCKEDPNILFIYKGYGEFKRAKELKAEGFKVYEEGYNEDCRMIKVPAVFDESQYILKAAEKGISKTKAKKDYKVDLPLLEKAKSEFDKKVAAGKYIKALMVEDHSGNNTGKYVYVELTPKESKSKKVDTKKNDITSKEIDQEIERINDWEKRKKEKDAEHIQVAISKAFKEYEKKDSLPVKPLPCNSIVINHLLLEMLPWHVKEDIFEVLKTPNLNQSKNLIVYQNALAKLTSTQITFIIRQIFLEKYSNNLPNSKNGFLFRLIAEQMQCFPIKEIVAAQAEKAKKRAANVKVRTAVLNEQKAELLKIEKSKSVNKTSKIQSSPKGKLAKKAA